MVTNKKSNDDKDSKKNRGPYHIHDWLQKFLFQYCGPCILEILGIPYTYKGCLNTELVIDGIKNLRVDVIIETLEGVIVIIEFQSTKPTPRKKHQFLYYIYENYAEHDKRIELYVVCNNEFEDGEFEMEFNKGDFFKIHRISLKNLNVDKIFENIECKLIQREEITRKEVIELMLSCYGSSKMTIEEVFVKIAYLLNLMVKFESLNNDEVKMFKQLLEFLSIRLVDESFQKEYKKVLDMNTSLYEDGYNEGIRVSNEKIKSMEQKSNEDRQKSNALERENNEVRQKNNMLERENNEVRQKSNALERENNEVRQKNNMLEQENNEVRQKNNMLERENNEVRQRIVNNMRFKGFSDEEINNLTEFSLDDIKSI